MNQSIPEIFKTICQNNHLSGFDLSGLTKTYLPQDYIAQFNETDYNFLNRLLFRAGIFYTFAMNDTGCTMMLYDQPLLLSKLDDPIEITTDQRGTPFISVFQQ